MRLGTALNAVRLKASWAIRDRFPDRKVVRNIQGVEMVLPWSHHLPDYTRGNSPYGKNLVALAAGLAATGDELTVLDIGANVGDSALQILDAAGGRVLCVEGDPYYFEYLDLNVGTDERVTVVEALLATGETAEALTPVRSGGTTRFEVAGESVGVPTVSAADLRAAHPEFARLRLAKSDTDGYEVLLVPAIAKAWADQPPVLFFEYDRRLTRMAGNDPEPIWDELAALGYDTVAIWDNGGRALGRAPIADLPRLSQQVDPTGPRDRRYWDVAVTHADDAAAREVLHRLVPETMGEHAS